MFWIWNSGIDIFLMRIECSYIQYSHETFYFASTHRISFLLEEFAELSWSEKWMVCIDSIQSGKKDILFQIYYRYIVVAGTRNTEKFCLACNGESRMIWINEWEFLLMVTFIQAVYIFFWASHVLWWADLFACVLHREQLHVLWCFHLFSWDHQIHVLIFLWSLLSSWRS